jgi:argininosuccinate lyase
VSAEDRTPARSLGGRFTEATDALLERINRSVDVDRRLWDQDVRGSKAHATMLAHVGLISADEARAIVDGLDAIHEELRTGAFEFLPSDEDIHMAVERRLGERIGAPARKLHTGRSRNDQVILDTTMWMRDAFTVLRDDLDALIRLLADRAEQGVDAPMPSFTHLQPAQVSSVGQWLCAHAAELSRARRRVGDLLARLDESPLGSGASAGTYLPIDRQHTATALGFTRPTLNATQTTGSRTDVIDAIGVLATTGVGLSRLGEELVLFASPAFAWLKLPDRLTTGSSLLPQKRNPDGAELLRVLGKLPAGDFAALASAASGLVSGYSKDLQPDKTLLFRSYDNTRDAVSLAALHVDAMSWDAARMEAACGSELAALWLADRLVLAGLPFREAHHLVGRAVRLGQDTGGLAAGFAAALGEHPVDGGEGISAELAGMTPAKLLAGLRTAGGAGPESVRAQIQALRGA